LSFALLLLCLQGHVEQFVDQLASLSGYVVIAPNYIPDPWPVDNIPVLASGKFPAGVEPADGINVCYQWIMSLPQDQTDLIKAVIEEYIHSNYPMIQNVVLVGMCFGGKLAYNAAKAGVGKAVAGCHAGFITKDDIEQINVPMCLLNSKDEPPLYDEEVKPAMELKSFGAKNFYKNFPTMHHGWMGSRGTGTGANTDFANAAVVEKFAEGVHDLVNFFHTALLS
jgi:dienelactone hydrolase